MTDCDDSDLGWVFGYDVDHAVVASTNPEGTRDTYDRAGAGWVGVFNKIGHVVDGAATDI